jgi:hypothetical protein
MGEYNNNKRVLFAEDVGSRKCGKQRSAAISISSISAAGWGLRFGHGFALGFKEAKCFAQCLISRVRVETRENKRYICQRSECPSLPAFCVEGEVPLDLDQATNRCGCTAIVLCGVRMKVPEKIFAHSFVEDQLSSVWMQQGLSINGLCLPSAVSRKGTLVMQTPGVGGVTGIVIVCLRVDKLVLSSP